jgi:hypothetical protein
MVVGIARIAPRSLPPAGTGGKLSKKIRRPPYRLDSRYSLAPKIAANKRSPSASARPQLPSVTRKRGSIRYAATREAAMTAFAKAGEGSEAFLTLVKRAKIDGL